MAPPSDKFDPLRVAVVGFGAAGQAICTLLAERPQTRVVAVGDLAPHRAGTPVAGTPDLIVSPELDPAATDCDVVVIATTSCLRQLAQTAGPWLDAQIDVVSICEELGYPWRVEPELALALDERARAGGVSVLGTGANPGFVMDVLPLLCSAALPKLSEVRVSRTIDLGDYGDLVSRFGLGEPPDRFEGLVASGEVSGHVGFEQSLSHLADVTGLPVDEMRVGSLELAALADAPRAGAHTTLQAGTVCATRQVARGLAAGSPVITLTEFFAFRPQGDEVPVGDRWQLRCGEHRLALTCPEGVPSLETTAAVTCNALEAAVAAPPGLLAMSDLRVRDIAARSR